MRAAREPPVPWASASSQYSYVSNFRLYENGTEIAGFQCDNWVTSCTAEFSGSIQPGQTRSFEVRVEDWEGRRVTVAKSVTLPMGTGPINSPLAFTLNEAMNADFDMVITGARIQF